MYLAIVIALILICLGYVLFMIREIKIINKGHNILVIPLRKVFRIDAIIMITLIGIVYYKAITNNYLDTTLITLLNILTALIIYIYIFRRPRLVFKQEGLAMSLGLFDYKHISNLQLQENGMFKMTLFNSKEIEFGVLYLEDLEKIQNIMIELNILNSKEKKKSFDELEKIATHKSIFPIKGITRDYPWGGVNYISKLLSLKQQLIAEYWLGTHPSACALIQKDDKYLSLQTLIDKDNSQISLEKELSNLPFLFKVLDVEKPLSIQLHPNKKQAENGFKLENMKKIPIDSPNRIYKDDNHKPELMVALSDFYLLHGFQIKEKIIKLLKERPLLNKLCNIVKEGSIEQIYSKIMTAKQDLLSELLSSHLEHILEQFNNKLDNPNEQDLLNPDYWVVFSIKSFNISMDKLDPGLSAFYLFNLIKLTKGQAIFQSANVPHAYLRGQNIEVMAQSDNVIRGGLTEKHIDIEGLLNNIFYEEITPNIITSDTHNKIGNYPVPVNDFCLDAINIDANKEIELNNRNASIIFILEGKSNLIGEDINIEISKGSACFISAGYNYKIINKNIKSEIYIASFN